MKKEFILIPYWVSETLHRNKLELSDCLDFKKIQPLLTLSDLAAMACLSDRHIQTVTGIADCSLGSLYFAWLNGLTINHDSALQTYVSEVLFSMAESEATKSEVIQRLFAAECPEAERFEKPFILYDLSPQYAGVVINPGFFGVNGNAATQLSLVEEMLKALYVYETYNEVAKSPLFLRQLELLRDIA
jgi:hypothetical protein